MARRGFWHRLTSFVAGGALVALLLTPAFATEESTKEQEADEKATASDKKDKDDAATVTEAEKSAPGDKAAQDPKAEGSAECQPTAGFNTLEDMFGIANWMKLQARAKRRAAPVVQIAWRDVTAD